MSKPLSRLRGVAYGWWLLAAGIPVLIYQAGTVSFSAGLLFEPLRAQFGWSAATIGLAGSLRRLEGGLLDPIVGFLIDRFGGRRLMIAGQVVIGGGMVLLSQVHTLWQFYLAYLLVSVGMSLGFMGTLSAMLVKWFDSRRGRVLGILASASALGAVLVPVMALLIIHLGWRTALLATGLGSWGLCLPLALTMRDRPPEAIAGVEATPARPAGGRRAPSVTVKEALRTRSFWLLALIGGVFSFHQSSTTLLLIPHLQSQGFSPVLAGSAVSLSYLIATPGRMFFGWLGDHIEPRRIFLFCLAVMVGGLLVLTQVTQFWHIIFYALTYGWAFGGAISLQSLILAEAFGAERFASIRGLTLPLSVAGGILGPLFTAFIFDVTGSYRPAFYSLAGIAALAVPMAWMLDRAARRDGPSPRRGGGHALTGA